MVKVRWIGPHFFFVGAVLPERASEARPGGLPRLVVKLSQKPLAVPAFTVQNGRAKSWVTLCSTTVDRAEISRINAHIGEVHRVPVPKSASGTLR